MPRRAASLALLVSLAGAATLGCLHLEIDGDVAGQIAANTTATACDPVICDAPDTDPAYPAALKELTVPSHDAALNAIVYVASGPGPHPVAILLHGYPGNERNGDLAQALRRAGWTVLFFHYRGTWGSPGTFTFTRALEDVAAAVDFVRTPGFAKQYRADPTRVALIGHSMGGFLALATAAEHAEVDCVVSMAGANLGLMGQAAASDPAARARLEQGFGGWSGPIRMAPRYAPVDELVANAQRFDLTRRAAALAKRPVLLVAGARDDVAPRAQHLDPLVAALASAGAKRATSVVLDADHAFSSQRIELAHQVVGWLGRSCL